MVIQKGDTRLPWRSMSDLVSFRYLVKLSRKYEINTLILLKCLHKAWIKGESSYKGLAIKRRKLLQDASIFQVLQDRKIIGQFRLTRPILDYLASPDIFNLKFEATKLGNQTATQEPENQGIELSNRISIQRRCEGY